MSEQKKITARVYHIVQYEVHPDTGEVLLTEEIIKKALTEHKSILWWAYIRHDHDVYTSEDETKNSEHKEGSLKPAHWHIVLKMKTNSTELSSIAKWFGIKENYIEMPKGRGAFLDCVEYLTHESEKQQELGKVLYDDSLVQSNFDWRGELDKRDEMRAKWGKNSDRLTPKQMLGQEIMLNGLTLNQAIERDPVLYADNVRYFQQCRGIYLQKQPAPSIRINYYVCGQGGYGKGLFCRGVARSLFPDLEHDDDIFFEVGAGGSTFEAYDGQPVIIWNDCRAFDLIQKLGGRENVFNVFDSHPTKQRQNIKYSSTALTNTVNLVNSVQPFREFLDGLSGEYTSKDGTVHESEDKGQAYRRFPLITEIKEEDFDLYINRGFVEDNKNFDEYISYKNIRGNLQTVMIKCGNNEKLAKELTKQTLHIVTEQHKKLVEKINDSELDEQQIRDELWVFGQQLLDLSKSDEYILQQRERHKRVQEYRKKGAEQITFEDITDIFPDIPEIL